MGYNNLEYCGWSSTYIEIKGEKMSGERFRDTKLNKNIAKFVVKNTKLLTIIACILLVSAIVGGLYAFFTDVVNVQTPITSGYASVQLQEDAPFDRRCAGYWCGYKY